MAFTHTVSSVPPRTSLVQQYQVFINAWNSREDFVVPIYRDTSALIFAFAHKVGESINFLSMIKRFPQNESEDILTPELQSIVSRMKYTMSVLDNSNSNSK